MDTSTLKQQFLSCASRFCEDPAVSEATFSILLSRYNESHRHYHTLEHIRTLLSDADAYFQGQVPAELFFAIWFHDAIYESAFGQNEKRSAELAEKTLRKMSCPQNIITACKSL